MYRRRHMVFTASEEMTSLCKEHGQVLASGAPDPSKCHATGKRVEVAVIGERATVFVQAVNFKERACSELVKSFESIAVSEITHTKVDCCIKRTGLSQYEISYQPTIKGRHQVHIKVEGEHIRGSIFSVPVISPVKTLGTPILIIDRVERPWGVAINHRGEVLASNKGRRSAQYFHVQSEW